ncbi:dynamin central region domain-containing protein [Ditylenchus destructor]|uniref:Dynamin central region domain-containing protein n=1 Tax=Ditylenchus destructor TaxID=166010 RepID=A0AAD4QZJ4_9BILA|nr:dynamin central region domain-containing protein [Ditylenchus destructor]
MNEVISIIDKVQDAIKAAGMDPDKLFKFPRFVVSGDQSSGKSSVIEGIVGHHFLPRGTGFVTRRPIVLRLVRVPLNDPRRSKEIGHKEWAKFGHRREIFTDFQAIHDEIVSEFQKVDGPNISEEEIILTIYSHKVVDVSLVDLPGFIRLHLEGQEKTLRTRIENLVYSYIEKDNTLILAVSSANTDIQNSGALSWAKEVDPNGNRTLALFTKLDNMGKGESAKDRLIGKGVQAKLGIIGVVNRSQEEVDRRQSVEECIADEAEFFRRHHPELSNTGVPFLRTALNKILIEHILRSLPSVELALQKIIEDKEGQLGDFADGNTDKTSKLVEVLREFEGELRADITGGYRRVQIQYESTGARINKILYKELRDRLTAIDPLKSLTEEEMRIAHENTRGYQNELNVGSDGFRVILRDRIRLLEGPCLDTIKDVSMEMKRATMECRFLNEQKSRFPVLVDGINAIFLNHLNDRLKPTEKFVTDMVDIECASVNFDNTDFLSSKNQLTKPFMDLQKAYITDKQSQPSKPNPVQNGLSKLEVSARRFGRSQFHINTDVVPVAHEEFSPNSSPELDINANERKASFSSQNSDNEKLRYFSELVGIYFDVVRKKLLDSVPKIIGKLLIEDFLDGKAGIGRHLVLRLNNAEELLKENEDTKMAREKLENELQTFKLALEAITDVKSSKSRR